MSSHHQPDHTESQETTLDAWHEHAGAGAVSRQEHGAHANTRALLMVFLVVSVSTVLFCLVIGMFAINQMNRLKGVREVDSLGAMAADAAAYKRDAGAAQAGYGWTAEGKVRLPIDQAMQMVVRQYQERQSQ